MGTRTDSQNADILPSGSESIEIRQATQADSAAIAALLLSAFTEFRPLYSQGGFDATTPPAEQIAARSSDGPTWIAFSDQRLLGTVSAVSKDNGLYIRSMAVHPSARGKGVGRLLLQHLENYSLENGHKRLFLCTTPFLYGAIHLYEQWGFTHIANSAEDLFGTPIFSMEKHLA